MPVTITPEQHKILARYRVRPLTLKQYYAARSLLSLGKGVPLPVVAKVLRRPESKVERWALGFEKAGIAYVRRLGRKGGPTDRPTMPGINALLALKKRPAPEGLDLDADPAELY
jgi:hypothetical protein